MSRSRTTDADDMFTETRMSFGDHIEELRSHLWRAIVGFFAIIVLCFILDGIGWATNTNFGIGLPVMKYMQKPVIDALEAYYNNHRDKLERELEAAKQDSRLTQPRKIKMTFSRKDLVEAGLNPPETAEKIELHPEVSSWDLANIAYSANRELFPGNRIVTMSVTEAMMVYFKVTVLCGIVLGSPWIFWQIWSFVAAGLYPHEKKYVNVYLPFSLGLFLAGVVLCELLVLPNSVAALLYFNEWLGLQPNLRLDEWLSFAIWLPIIFGVAFQTPLVMMFLNRIGIVEIDAYRRYRRFAWFGLAILAAILSPSPDLVTWSCMWVPMWLLYELGIYLCKLSPRKDEDIDVHEPDELVEV